MYKYERFVCMRVCIYYNQYTTHFKSSGELYLYLKTLINICRENITLLLVNMTVNKLFLLTPLHGSMSLNR